jgi:hypothetical protein
MTNLNKIGVMKSSKILRKILKTLNINYDEHEKYLVKLCAGKLKRLNSNKEYVNQDVEINFTFNSAPTIELFFENAKKELIESLSQRNIDANNIKTVSYDFEYDEDGGYKSDIMVNIDQLEIDSIYESRMNEKRKIDILLDNETKMFELAKEIIEGKTVKKKELEDINLQIQKLQQKANQIKSEI